ncbi:MAG: hypothetical protein E6G92_11015 [Alphaproteobacteria bacterium]|nr:MAG: hypothetical protein E6G92_11015 [Alphaproteobacteria bacterium]
MRKIISRGSSKEAALFFDEVFPNDVLVFALAHVSKGDVSGDGCVPMNAGAPDKDVIASLLPKDKKAQRRAYRVGLLESAALIIGLSKSNPPSSPEEFDTLNEPIAEAMRREFNFDFSYSAISADVDGWLTHLSNLQDAIFRQAGFGKAPEWVSESFLVESDSSDNRSDEALFAMSLSNLALVDSQKLTWDQIIEFRKDNKSRSALRDLRLFFQDDLSGKSPAYISDKLGQLVDRQEKASKLWGFETTQKTLSVAFTNRSILATSAGGIAAAVAGAPLSVAAAAALAIPLGGCVLEFSKAWIEAKKSQIERPTKFLTQLKKLGMSANLGD